MNTIKLLLFTVVLMVSVLMVVAITDLIRPYDPIETVITSDMIVLPEQPSSPNIRPVIAWEDDINNPDNAPYVVEVAFNESCTIDQVTQHMFNLRYLTDQ